MAALASAAADAARSRWPARGSAGSYSRGQSRAL